MSMPLPCPDHLEPSETELLLKGWGISTIEACYRMPDHQLVLNSLVVQMVDLAPDYPRLFAFVEFWKDNIDGPLHSIRFTHARMLGPRQWRHVVGEFPLH